MAVRHGYGKIAGADALVFAYDTGDTRNSYKGEPTVNLLRRPSTTALANAGDIYGNATKTSLGNGKYRFVNDGTGVTTIRMYAHLSDLTNNVAYACSISYEEFDPGDGTAVILDWCDVSSDTYSVNTYGTANRASTVSTRSEYSSTYRFFDVSLPTNSSIVLFNDQIEQKSHPTQFTEGTRSATEGLKDLTGNSQIDMADTTFDSNAIPVYDGTNARAYSAGTGQYFNSNAGDTSFSNGATYEFVLKAFGTGYFAGIGTAFRISAGTNSFLFWDRSISTGTSETTTGIGNLSVTDNYVHVIGVLDPINNQKRFYINGEEELNISYDRTPSMGTTPLGLGKSYPNSNNYCNCELPVTKVYNRALTAGEVKNNYSHYKNRFGI